MQGFKNITLNVCTSNGLNDILLEPLVYETKYGVIYRAPINGTTDGLSVPRCVQNIIPATGGDWFSGVLHDSAYRGELETEKNGVWVKVFLSQINCDNLILEAMESQRVGAMRHVIYRALRMFGSKAFNEDRKVKVLSN